MPPIGDSRACPAGRGGASEGAAGAADQPRAPPSPPHTTGRGRLPDPQHHAARKARAKRRDPPAQWRRAPWSANTDLGTAPPLVGAEGIHRWGRPPLAATLSCQNGYAAHRGRGHPGVPARLSPHACAGRVEDVRDSLLLALTVIRPLPGGARQAGTFPFPAATRKSRRAGGTGGREQGLDELGRARRCKGFTKARHPRRRPSKPSKSRPRMQKVH